MDAFKRLSDEGFFEPFRLFCDQFFIVIWKNWKQKLYHRRETLKDAISIPLAVALLGFIIMSSAFSQAETPGDQAEYGLRTLAPFSKDNGGIYDPEAPFNKHQGAPQIYGIVYSPKNHTGLNNLMNGLHDKWKILNVTGVDDINDTFHTNIFSILYGIEFTLSSLQYSTGLLVPSQTSNNIQYLVRANPYLAANAAPYDSFVYNDLMCSADTWLDYGYLTLQNYIQENIAKQAHPNSATSNGELADFSITTFAQRYPKSSIYNDNFTVGKGYLRWMVWKWIAAPFFAVICIIPMLGMLVQIVKEREGKVLDLLEISGLTPMALVLGYFVFIFALSQLSYILTCLIYRAAEILTAYTSRYYLSLNCLFTLAIIPQAMCFGFIIHKYEYYGLPVFIFNMALAVGGDFLANAATVPASLKGFLVFLFPTTGLPVGIFAIESLSYHHPNQKLDWSVEDHRKGLPAPNSVLAIMFFSAVFWTFIWWGFPFKWVDTLWEKYIERNGPIADSNIVELTSQNNENINRNQFEDLNGPLDKFKGSEVLLSVKNVYHVYPDGTPAVKNVSFDIRAGEVLSYLGSNGAGKSTTMGMLCGTLPITKGEIVINGHNVSKDLVAARRSLGICSQQDILWDDISVEDHLYIFGMIRGLTKEALTKGVQQMVQDLGFPEKAKSLSGTLSGGQKRRLCAGISMIGGNSVVLLDEPTAGLDPVSRRQLWQLVQKNRAGKAILLTTHFMDEADILGDRMTVLKDGMVKAIGSSQFLKNVFGVGYIIKFSTFCELNQKQYMEVLNNVKNFIPDVALVSKAGTELILRLPKSSVSCFPDMLHSLEVNSASLLISSFGIETTKLEEVFMKIVEMDTEVSNSSNNQLHNTAEASASTLSPSDLEIEVKGARKLDLTLLLEKGRYDLEASCCENLRNHISPFLSIITTYMLVKKRFFQFIRSRGQFVMGILLPFIMIIIIASLQKGMPEKIFLDNPPIVQLSSSFAVDVSLDMVNISTPVAGPSKSATQNYDQNAFYDNCPTCNLENGFIYLGNSSSDVYDYIKSESKSLVNGSTNGVYYQSQNEFTVYYNASYPFNFISTVSSLLRGAISNATAGSLSFVELWQPFPDNLLNSQLNAVGYSTLCMGIFSGSIGSGLSIVLGGERTNGVKHLQVSSGASKLSYWAANFFWDFLIAYYNVLLLCIALAIALPDYYGGKWFPILPIAGLFYTVVAISRFHILSFVIADIKLAQTVYFYFTLFLTYTMVTIYFGVVLNGGPINLLSPMAYYTSSLMSVIEPSFGLSMIMNYQHNFLSVRTQNGDVTGLYCGALILIEFGFTFLAQLIILYLMEFGFVDFINKIFSCFETKYTIIRKPHQRHIDWDLVSTDAQSLIPVSNTDLQGDVESQGISGIKMSEKIKTELQMGSLSVNSESECVGGVDSDVLYENNKVRSLLQAGTIKVDEHTILDFEVSKTFFGRGSVPTKIAVKAVSLSVPHGEIFGLLGANGAGKSTLIKIMSGLEYPSSGKCLINGYDIVRDKTYAQRSMGLCPQFDTLIDRLTVRENLRFFANIKGVPRDKVKVVAEAYLDALDIRKYQHKLIMRLSGGNRRKLSLAVALIGCPPTVYLDEPSTGLDPVASRHMWRLLQKVSQAKKSAIVLTTHNMMECEAVCHRITIMKQGEFSCIGNSQHLRSKHGAGYMLEVIVDSTDFVDRTMSFVTNSFTGAILVDKHETMLNYEVPKGSIKSLSDAFRTLESGKTDCGIIDYTLSQSSLEQVFLKTIRPPEADGILIDEDNFKSKLADPTIGDFILGFLSFFFALLIPGLHHFVLGNTWRGFLYLFTFNELYIGWFLDLFEIHILIRKSVQEYGHLNCWLCTCCYNIWTCCRCYCCRRLCCWWSDSMRLQSESKSNDTKAQQIVR